MSPQSAVVEAAKKIIRDELPEKTRIHQLSRLLGVDNARLGSALTGFGVENTHFMATVNKEILDDFLDTLIGVRQAQPAEQESLSTALGDLLETESILLPDSSADFGEDTTDKGTAAGDTVDQQDQQSLVEDDQLDAGEGQQALDSREEEPELKEEDSSEGNEAVFELFDTDTQVVDTAGENMSEELSADGAFPAWLRSIPQFLAPDQDPSAEEINNPALEAEYKKLVTSSDAADQNGQQEYNADSTFSRADGESGQDLEEAKETKNSEELHPAERDEADVVDEPVQLEGSTRLHSKKKWRNKQENERPQSISEAEFLARRESVRRSMYVRESSRHDGKGMTIQVGVTEDNMLVEHFVTSESQQSLVGGIYLGRVQNVLSSMEAAFIDIGTGRNGVLYAGEINWAELGVKGKKRRIEKVLKSGDQVLVQVMKDPIGHKGARLSMYPNLAGRFLAFVPGISTSGISRKLPEPERRRLKKIMKKVLPKSGGAIIRTAAENISEEMIAADVERLQGIWAGIKEREAQERSSRGAKPVQLYSEPDMLIRVIRDVFNEDFAELIVDGKRPYFQIRDYLKEIAPDLQDRLSPWIADEHGGENVFEAHHLEEQLAKALARKVWLPSGGYLIIERTEAMTVIDVNTGSFVGASGNLEETLTQNNLEAAEEIVRQMRLRDLGGMIVVDFIDMVLQENQDLVLRRLAEYLGRDRTHHRLSEVTSLGLVQITRRRMGTGLLETFSTPCDHCDGRGIIIHEDPVEQDFGPVHRRDHGGREAKRQARQQQELKKHSYDRSSKTDKNKDNAGDKNEEYGVQDIVSAALSHAYKEDPDEPTGEKYLPAGDYAYDASSPGEKTKAKRVHTSAKDVEKKDKGKERDETEESLQRSDTRSTPSKRIAKRTIRRGSGYNSEHKDSKTLSDNAEALVDAVIAGLEDSASDSSHGGKNQKEENSSRRKITHSPSGSEAKTPSPEKGRRVRRVVRRVHKKVDSDEVQDLHSHSRAHTDKDGGQRDLKKKQDSSPIHSSPDDTPAQNSAPKRGQRGKRVVRRVQRAGRSTTGGATIAKREHAARSTDRRIQSSTSAQTSSDDQVPSSMRRGRRTKRVVRRTGRS